MAKLHLALKYSVFATIATIVNLLTQEAAIRIYEGSLALYLSISMGTVTGLVTKYQLDKHYIFQFRIDSRHQDLRKFVAYTLTGGFTTALFWGSELGFEFWFGTKTARYAGAVLGLASGYAVKYRLDKRYVFVQQES